MSGRPRLIILEVGGVEVSIGDPPEVCDFSHREVALLRAQMERIRLFDKGPHGWHVPDKLPASFVHALLLIKGIFGDARIVDFEEPTIVAPKKAPPEAHRYKPDTQWRLRKKQAIAAKSGGR